MDEWQDGLFWVNAANLEMNGVLFILIKKYVFSYSCSVSHQIRSFLTLYGVYVFVC